jgi:hypothetical protein
MHSGIEIMAQVEIDLGNLKDTCFVIMPFSPVFSSEYSNIIRPAIETTELKCVRADEIYSKPQVTADIWKALRSSRIVIAELSGKNINVFYELGLAHALGKPVIIITRNEKDVPFDLKALRYLYYDINNPAWGDNLKNNLIEMIQSVLKETEYGAVFEGIKVTGIAPYEKKVANKSKITLVARNVAGMWEGEMIFDEDKYEIKCEISQKESELTGIMILCYPTDKDIAVVQESIAGSVRESFVLLKGVSYTFEHQGGAKGYYLDTFSGAISKDGGEISGDLISDNRKGKFSLRRIT